MKLRQKLGDQYHDTQDAFAQLEAERDELRAEVERCHKLYPSLSVK